MTDSHTRSSKVANLMSLPDQTERYEVKMHQAHDAINVCKALLIKHNHEYATRKRWVKPSDMFSHAAAFLQPLEEKATQEGALKETLPISALELEVRYLDSDAVLSSLPDAASPLARASCQPDSLYRSSYHSPCHSLLGAPNSDKLTKVNTSTPVAGEAWQRARKHRVENSDGMVIVRELIKEAPYLLRRGVGTMWQEVNDQSLMKAEAAFAAAIATGEQQNIAAAEQAVVARRQKLREVVLAAAIAPGQEVIAAAVVASPPEEKASAMSVMPSEEEAAALAAMSPDEIAFHKFADEDGEISLPRLAEVLKYLGIKASEEEVEQMFNTADADGGGGIDLEEFTAALGTDQWGKVNILDTLAKLERETVEAAFHKFADESGEISLPRLAEVLKDLGIEASEEDIEQMFNTADADGGGTIDLEEFTVALKTDQWEEVKASIGWGGLLDTKIENINASFNKFKSTLGRVDMRGLTLMLKDLRIELSKDGVEQMFNEAKVDGNNGIDFADVCLSLKKSKQSCG